MEASWQHDPHLVVSAGPFFSHITSNQPAHLHAKYSCSKSKIKSLKTKQDMCADAGCKTYHAPSEPGDAGKAQQPHLDTYSCAEQATIAQLCQQLVKVTSP